MVAAGSWERGWEKGLSERRAEKNGKGVKTDDLRIAACMIPVAIPERWLADSPLNNAETTYQRPHPDNGKDPLMCIHNRSQIDLA